MLRYQKALTCAIALSNLVVNTGIAAEQSAYTGFVQDVRHSSSLESTSPFLRIIATMSYGVRVLICYGADESRRLEERLKEKDEFELEKDVEELPNGTIKACLGAYVSINGQPVSEK